MKKLLLAAILFLGAAPCWGQCSGTNLGNTITCVQKTPAVECSSASSCATGAFASNTTTSNALVVFIEWQTAGGVSLTCSSGMSVSSGAATWALAVTNLGVVWSESICYATAITGGTTPTVTATMTGGSPAGMSIIALELSGLAASPLDVTLTGTGGGAGSFSFGPTSSTAQLNEYVACGIANNGGGTPINTPGGGFVIEQSNTGQSNHFSYLDKPLSAVGTATCSATFAAAPAEWDGVIASFKAASSGSTTSGGIGGKAGGGGKLGIGYWQPIRRRRELLQ